MVELLDPSISDIVVYNCADPITNQLSLKMSSCTLRGSMFEFSLTTTSTEDGASLRPNQHPKCCELSGSSKPFCIPLFREKNVY